MYIHITYVLESNTNPIVIMLLNNYLTHAQAIPVCGFYCIVLNLIEIFTIVQKIFDTDDLILCVTRLRTQNILVFKTFLLFVI